MLAFHWLNRFVTYCCSRGLSRLSGGTVGRPATTRPDTTWTPQRERRLKLMRLEQRRVLNADFSFVAQANLTLSNVDGDLAVREVGSHFEFDLTGSVWDHVGGNGTFSIDNSVANHSVLSIDRSEFGELHAGISISADPNGAHRLTLETQNSAIDLQMVAGPLAIRDFEDVQQVGTHDLLVNDFSVTARNTIELQHLRGDDLTLSAAEIDFNGGSHSIAGSSLSVVTGTDSAMELGGSVDHANVLDFTSADLGALSGGFQSISFSAHGDHSSGSMTVLSSGADVRDALSPAGQRSETQIGDLHLSADTIQIVGELTSAGGLIDVRATQAVTISHSGGVVSHGGEIVVDAGTSGTLLVSGRVDVSSVDPQEVDPHGMFASNGIGGSIHLLGERVGLFGGARVDASGDSGGGEVLIGGDLLGDNAAIPHALRAYVGSDVEINADAIQHGDGGKVVVWSDEVSQVYGLLTARGGALSGDGGLIETSSHGQLLLSGGGDASAANGNAGTWLLDPLNVGIVHQLTLFPTIIEFNELPDFAPSVSGSEVTDDAIEAQLSMGTNVVITTENLNYSEAGNVTQAADAIIDVTFIADGDTATLTINAANNIVLNGGITASNGAISVVLNANAITNNDDLDLASGNVTINAAIDLNGGSFTSTGVDFDSTGGAITAAGGVTITQTGQKIDLGQINTGTGTGGTLLLSGATAHDQISVGEGNVLINGGNHDTVVMANVSASASVIISANQDVIVQATIEVTGPTSDLTITADSDSDGVGGFWLDEGSSAADAQLKASHNITIIGSSLVATATANDDVRIDRDIVDPQANQVIAGNDLTLLSNFDAASTAGDIVIDGIQVATSGSLTVFSNDQIFLGADQTAGDKLLFKSAVQMTNDVTVIAGDDVTYDSTVDDDGSIATGSALTVTTVSPGAGVLFVGAVGANPDSRPNYRLDSLVVNGAGFVDFLDTVAIGGDINVSTTSSVGIVTFQNAVSTTTGLGGAVTGSVTITNAGLLVTSSLATFDLAGSFTQTGAGSTELGADITTADGDVSFAQAVLLTDSVKIDTSKGNGDITFSSTIDSEVVPLALLDGELVPVSQVSDDVVAVIAEHNSLELTAGAGVIRFDGDIGAGYIDVNAGMDGDQTLGSLTINSADSVLIGPVTTIAIDGLIDIGHVSVITNGIHIAGIGDPHVTTIRSDHADIRINGQVIQDVDLIINAANGVELTDDAGILTNNHNITINGDTDQDRDGDLRMGPNTLIDSGMGFIDLSANNIRLGALLTTNANPTDADHPAVRVEATTGSITDGGDVFTDIDASTPGSGVVLLAVKGIGSDLSVSDGADNALETDIVSLVAYNHDINPLDPALAADGNILIHDVGMEANHRVDLIFIHNEANQTQTQFAIGSQGFVGTFAPPRPRDPIPPPVDVQFEFFAVTPGMLSNDIVIHFTASSHTGIQRGVPTIVVTGHIIDIDLDSNGTAANILRDEINSNELAKGLIQARITSPAETVESNIAASAKGKSVSLSGAGIQVGVIDVSVDMGDLRVVTDPSRPLLFELLQPGPPSGDPGKPALITAVDPPFADADQVVPAIQAENTIRFTAENIEIFDDILAIQDVNSTSNGINEFIEINARGNFTLGAGRVISTDENYAGSLVVGAPQKEMIHNVTHGQDAIHITADFNRDSTNFTSDGTVQLEENSTISTDVGIEQQISPRPVRQTSDPKDYNYTTDSAFFSGKIIVSNLQSIEVGSKDPVYLGSLTFTIGVPGERNLVLDIDWGDGVSAPFKNNGSAPVLRSGGFEFDPNDSNKFATRFLIPEGGLTYKIPHQYTQNALNLKNTDGRDIPLPGRTLTTDPLQVRFAVSQHESISIEGQSVFNPDAKPSVDTPDIPKNAPYNTPASPLDDNTTVLNREANKAVPQDLNHNGLFTLSSTNVTDTPTAFLPRFDNGQASFTIPTSKAVSFFVPADPVIVPIDAPKLITTETVVVTPAQLTTETTIVSGSSSAVTTTEYFELRRFNDDGTVEIERLNDFNGDGLLDKERFEKFISDKGDGEYEIWFITRENTSGTMIERPVIHFRLEGGHLAPPPNDSPLLFKPFRLIPLPAVPKPANEAGEAAGNSDAAEDNGQQPKLEIQEDKSSDSTQSSNQSTGSSDLSANDDISHEIEFANLDSAVQAIVTQDHSSSNAASLAAGVLVFAGTRRWKRQATAASSSSFSRSSRLARKLTQQ